MGLLRACSGAVVIGAGTLRAEPRHRWTPGHVYPQAAADFAELRRRLGLPGTPALVVVTASGRLGSHAALGPGALVLTTPTGAAGLEGGVPPGVEVVGVGEGHRVSPRAAVALLSARGYRRVLCEGGPALFGDFLAAGVVEELFLTLSPAMFGSGPPAVGLTESHPATGEAIARAELLGARRDGSHLFLRYGVNGPSPSGGR